MKYVIPLALVAIGLIADDKKSDKERIQGTWVATGVEAKGAAVKEGDLFEQVKDMKLTFTIDPDKKPPTLDVEIGPPRKETMRMLYRFKDDNTLQLCGQKNDERPKEFGSKDDQIV